MRKKDGKIIQTFNKIKEDIDTLSLNDCDAWKNSCAELESVIRDIPEKKMHGLFKLIGHCVEGLQAVSEKSVDDPLTLTDAIYEALDASEKYLKDDPNRAVLIDDAAKKMVGAIGKDTPEPDLPTTQRSDNSTTHQLKTLSLDDAAAFLVQLEADDLAGLGRFRESLNAIVENETLPESSLENIVQAVKEVGEIIDASASDPGSTMAEIGRLLEKAMDAMDENLRPEQNSRPSAASVSEQKDKPASEESKSDYMPEEIDHDLMGEFITEGMDLITNAEEALLSLENDPEDTEAIGTVFRAFHTIKGNSAFLELSIVTEMAHHAESLLSRVRDHEIHYSGGYADLALRSLDMIKELIQAVQDALSGNPLPKPEGYDDLMQVLEDPEKAGISEKDDEIEVPEVADILVAQGKVDSKSVEDAKSPRVGDILVAEGKAERQKLENAEANKGETPIGVEIIRSKAADAKDVAQALRTQNKMRGPKKQVVEASVRVSTERLDRLIDTVGELVVAHSMVAQDKTITNADDHDIIKKIAHTSKIVRELQDMSMSLRMVPLKMTFQKMTRLVRDLARKMGKNVRFVTEGEDTEIDRNMADAIKDPLVHMIRNAVDHGIEMPDVREKAGKPKEGTVNLSAYHSAGSVVVEVKDDGKGLDRQVLLAKAREKGLVEEGASLSDREVFNLIFEPGFSTAKTVTDVSGRGVGMDVVRKNIEALRGHAEIQSELGKGSVFQMRLPLTLAIIDGMVARVGSEAYVIPTLSIVTSIKAEQEDLSTVLKQGEMLSLQGRLIPLFRLDKLFQIEGVDEDADQEVVVVVEDNGTKAGLIIDELTGRQQVVIKTLGETMRNIPGVSGGAIMPSGNVGLILDVGGLIKLTNAGNG